MTIDNNVISAVGLFLDIFGVVLVYHFGVSPTLYDQSNGSLIIGMTEDEKATAKKYKKFSKWGLGLIFAGFILQAIGNEFIYNIFKNLCSFEMI